MSIPGLLAARRRSGTVTAAAGTTNVERRARHPNRSVGSLDDDGKDTAQEFGDLRSVGGLDGVATLDRSGVALITLGEGVGGDSRDGGYESDGESDEGGETEHLWISERVAEVRERIGKNECGGSLELW